MSKKECEWCELLMFSSNFKKHDLCCFYKVTLGLKKSEIEEIKKIRDINPIPNSNNKINKDITYLQMKKFFLGFHDNFSKIYELLSDEDNLTQDPSSKIHEFLVSDGTKKNYVAEWNMYLHYLKKKNISLDVDSANTNLSSLKCKNSTLYRKQRMLQKLFRKLINSRIYLNEVGGPIEYSEKYPISLKELEDYLGEQYELDEEYFLIQSLLGVFGVRVSSTAALKLKHLTFMFMDEDVITLPDVK
jgi:hypothetical protein